VPFHLPAGKHHGILMGRFRCYLQSSSRSPRFSNRWRPMAHPILVMRGANTVWREIDPPDQFLIRRTPFRPSSGNRSPGSLSCLPQGEDGGRPDSLAVLQDQGGHDPTAATARHEWRGGQWLPSTSGAMEIHKTRRSRKQRGALFSRRTLQCAVRTRGAPCLVARLCRSDCRGRRQRDHRRA